MASTLPPPANSSPDMPEEWAESDFDFSDVSPAVALRPPSSLSIAHSAHSQPGTASSVAGSEAGDSTPAASAEPAPARSFADADDAAADGFSDEDEDQVDTIKFSALAGDTLAQLAAASSASKAGRSAAASAEGEAFSGTVTHLQAARAPVADVEVDWDEDLEMPEALPSAVVLRRPASYTSADTDFDSGMGETSDGTTADLHAGSHGSSPRRRTTGSSCSSAASSLLSPQQLNSKAQGVVFPSAETETDDFEGAFELGPEMDRLQLSPTITRQRSQPALEQQKQLWGDAPGKRSSSPDADAASRPSRDRSAGGSSIGLHCMESSDADDEEDLLDGLEVPDDLFGEVTPTDGGPLAPQSPREKLQAMLNARRGGLALGQADETVPLSPTESDADFATGLVISDDLDLSPSRLHAKSLSYKLRGPPPSSRRSRNSAYTAQSGVGRSAQASRRSTLSDTRSTPSQPPPPSVTVTTSSPQLARVAPSGVKSSPPRAPSAYSHAPGSGPRPGTLSAVRPLRYKKSVGDLAPSTTPAAAASSAVGTSSRPISLSRKRSLPHLSVDAVPAPASVPQQASRGGAEPAGSRLLASTAASRARAAEVRAARERSITADGHPPARPNTPSSFMPTRGGASRFTMHTASSLARASETDAAIRRPASPLAQALSAGAAAGRDAAVRMLRRPKRGRTYGDGHELESFDDLPTSSERESRTLRESGRDDTLRARGSAVIAAITSRWSEASASVGGSRSRRTLDPTMAKKVRQPAGKRGRASGNPTLICHLGSADAAPRVVGDMRWNMSKQKWEGNEAVLRDFDNAMSSNTRPALITQLTGSSTSSFFGAPTSPPPGIASSGARVVGDMRFDPLALRWVSAHGIEEPDPFADLAELDENSSQNESADVLEAAPTFPSSGAAAARRARSTDLLRDAAGGSGDGKGHSRRSASSAVASAVIEAALERRDAEPPAELAGFVDTQLWASCLEASRRHDDEVRAFLPTRNGAETARAAGKEHLYLLQRLARQAASR